MTDPEAGQQAGYSAMDAEQGIALEQEAAAWLGWLRSAGETGSTFMLLLQAELRLALRSAGGILLLVLLMLPLCALLWLGLSVTVGWLAYMATTSVLVGLSAFTLLQLLVLLLLIWQVKVLQRRLRLPASRQQLQAFLQETGSHGQSPTDH